MRWRCCVVKNVTSKCVFDVLVLSVGENIPGDDAPKLTCGQRHRADEIKGSLRRPPEAH